MADASEEASGCVPGGSGGNNEAATLQPVVTDGFKAIGPDPIGKKKKKYKFVEPPGITTWIFSFAKKCLACGLIYAFGYFRISVGWLVGPIVLMVVRDQWRRHHDAKRAIAQAAAKGDEREIILARLGDNLPSWVIFPDVERAEWLNMIIKQLWPRINHYVYDLVVQSIEPGLRETLSTSYKMGSFKFEKVILGDTPIRVRGVKVYDERKTDRNEIIMDMEVIYAGDCDVRFSLSKMKAGIKDLQLHGTMRLVMKPLINQMPLIGGVQYFFLNPPSLDFNLIGIADVLDMPGLADLIRRIVQEQIAAMCVLPNKMFVQLAENVNARETCALRPQGVIRICAVEARNLLKKDVGVLGMGKSDPYVVLQVGAQSFKSKIINNTVTPKWDFHCEMMVEEIGQKLLVTLYDYDEMPRQDEFLGRTSVDLSLVKREGSMDVWLDLEDVKKGQIRLRLDWLTFSENPVDLKSALHQAENHGLASCMLTVHLDSVKNLPVLSRKATGLSGINFGKNSQIPSGGSKPDPYAILSVGKTQHESTTMEKTTDPVFEQTLHFLVRNPLTDTLLVKLMDRKTSLELGAMKQPLDLVYGRPGMTMEKQNFTLNTRSEAKVVLDMQLVVLKPWTQGMEDDDLDDEIKLPGDPTPPAPIPVAKATQEPTPAQSSVGTIEHVPGTELKRTSSIKQPITVEDMVVRSEESKPLLSSAPSVEENKNMKIRLTIRYSQTTHQLIVVVHSVANLPIEQEELPDPYVKLYVLPERNKKHKTEAQKDQCNPLYDERFEFPLIDLRGKTLEVTVCDKKYIRSSPKLGDVRVALDDFVTGNSVTNWYPLVD